MPPHALSIRLRASTYAAFLLWVCLGALGCSKGPVVVVSVSNIGPMTTELRILTLVDQQPASSEIRVPHDGRERAEFGLRFPVHIGNATLSIGAYSSGGCLISTGTRTLLLEDNHQDVDLAMGEAAPEYAASCRQSTPVIRRITQSPSGRRLVIEGWAFLPRSRVQLDGKDATGPSFKSPERIEVDEPTTPNPTGRLRIELTLTNPDNHSDKKPFDLLALVFEDAASHSYSFASGLNPRTVGLGDFNGDSKTDIAVAGAQGNEGFIALFLNQGQGLFSPRMPFQKLPSVASGIVVADFNQDGRADVAVTSTDTGSVSVLRGDGSGGFGAAESVPTGAKPYYIAGGEVLGSGRVDLAVVTDPFSLNASSNLSLLTNVNGGMSFTSTPALFTSTMESRVFGPAAIGDLDRDGLSEIIITSLGRFTVMGGQPFASGAFTILSHTGGGSFTTFGPLLARMAYGDLTLNDFDRNGRNDLAFVGGANDNMGDNVVDLHLLQGNGTFEEPPLYSGGPRSPLRPTVVSGDLNGDAWPDLILSNPADSGSGTLGVLLNQGNAVFPQAAPVTYPAGAGVLMLAAGDLNGDQRLDVVVTADGDVKGKTPGSLHIYIQAARN